MPSTAVHPYDAFDALLTEIVNYASENTRTSIDSSSLCEQLLDNIGFTVSQRLIDRATKDHSRFANELDIVKYVCTEFWASVFHKQVDTLKTNYQDMYVLFLSEFCLLERIARGPQYQKEAVKYLAFPAGLLRGALCSLGIKCTVNVDCEKLPSCKFTIKVLRST
ncbi:Trafficking protein particle complex subunit 6B [Fasciola hepatica]|uniref:Trafficking protein particle complex subunit 6B n=1 Tax=Fasciola hepatica TaxID=6192 RepID=A0A2H1CRQ3_FASHE|nr:Trafficking protein particle complex subunit 6B [Fasciola hepatica]